MYLIRGAQAPGNRDRGLARADREDALGVGNSLKTRSLEELIGGGSSGRYTPSRRTIGALLGEAYYLGIDSLSKGEE